MSSLRLRTKSFKDQMKQARTNTDKLSLATTRRLCGNKLWRAIYCTSRQVVNKF